MDVELGFVLIFGALFIGLALAVGAVILRAACHLLGQHVPRLFAAMGILLIAGLLSGIVNFAWGFAASLAMGTQIAETGGQVVLYLVAALIAMCIYAGTYAMLIPGVNFGKGVAIYWLQTLITVVVVAMVVAPLALLA